jgi:hypothetical protein
MTAVHHATDTLHAEGNAIRTKASDLELLAQRLLQRIPKDAAQSSPAAAANSATQKSPLTGISRLRQKAPRFFPLSKVLRLHPPKTAAQSPGHQHGAPR